MPDKWEGRKRNQMQGEGDTHKGESVPVQVIVGIFLQFLVKCPSRGELDRFGSSAQDRDDVWVL